jgi:hypothetical protein
MNDQVAEYVRERQPFICILIPCYTGSCRHEFVDSLIKTSDLCKMNRIRCKYIFVSDDTLNHRCKNNLLAKAMAIDGISHFLFIDSDVIWQPYDVFKLLLSDKYIVGGAVPRKEIMWNNIIKHPNCINVFNNKNKTQYSNELFFQHKLVSYNTKHASESISIHKNLTRVEHISTGFLMIKRAAIEKMICAFPNTKYDDNLNVLNENENKNAHSLFDTYTEKNDVLTEDWVFCRRWQNMGGSIWLNVAIDLSTTGQYIYNGSYYNSLI